MNFLVGSLVLSGGERVVIVWSDGRRTEAVYQDTFGYTHVFVPQGEGRERASAFCLRTSVRASRDGLSQKPRVLRAVCAV